MPGWWQPITCLEPVLRLFARHPYSGKAFANRLGVTSFKPYRLFDRRSSLFYVETKTLSQKETGFLSVCWASPLL